MKSKQHTGIFLAVLAAALYAVNAPFSKLLLSVMPSTLMAGFLYWGAGLGMGILFLIRKGLHLNGAESRLTKAELPYTIAMIVLDIAAPIFLLFGLNLTSAANASLLNNFEIVATALIALAVFREKISFRLWLGIGFVTAACAVLSLEPGQQYTLSYGSVFILLACVCWGIENNCTRKISSKDPLQIVLLKGIFSGHRLDCDRPAAGRTDRRMVEYSRRARRGARRLWAEYLLLCLCTAKPRCRAHQRVLCYRPVHRNGAFARDFLAAAARHLFCSRWR